MKIPHGKISWGILFLFSKELILIIKVVVRQQSSTTKDGYQIIQKLLHRDKN